jgi:hypothetical protein
VAKLRYLRTIVTHQNCIQEEISSIIADWIREQLNNIQLKIFGLPLSKSRDSSIGIALGYGLDDRGSIPGGTVQNGSGVHSASYPMGTRGSFPGGEADHSPPSIAEVIGVEL